MGPVCKSSVIGLASIARLGHFGARSVRLGLRDRLAQTGLLQQRQHAIDEERKLLFEIEEAYRGAGKARPVQFNQIRRHLVRCTDQRYGPVAPCHPAALPVYLIRIEADVACLAPTQLSSASLSAISTA